MNHYMSSSDLRDKAKEKLDGFYFPAIMIFLLGTFLEMCFKAFWVNVFGSFGADVTNPASTASLISTGIASVFTGVFQIGYAYFYLNLYCGKEFRMGNILYGYQNHTYKSLVFSAIFAAMDFICTVPTEIIFRKASATQDYKLLTVAFLLIALDIVVYGLFFIYTNLSVYIMLDFPEKSIGEIFSLSFKLMKGNFFRFLYLMATFIPMLLLAILSFGLALLWIIPYFSMTRVIFFMDLMHEEPEPKLPEHSIDVMV